MLVLKRQRWVFIFSVVLQLMPLSSPAANIDEIAYLTNKTLKDLSTRAMSMIGSPALGICGRRRELKITGRGLNEKWPEIIQSALRRESSTQRSVRIQSELGGSTTTDTLVNRLLAQSGYQTDVAGEVESSVKSFKEGLKASSLGFSIFSGQVRGVDLAHDYSFLAFADEKNSEVLILCLGEDLCR